LNRRKIAEEIPEFFEFFIGRNAIVRFLFGEILTALSDLSHAFSAFIAAIDGLHAMFIDCFAVFPGEDAEEIHEYAGSGIGTGCESESALFNDGEAGRVEINALASEETEQVLDGRGVAIGDLKLFGEIEARAIAVEAVEGDLYIESGAKQ
jgi:hypothetical protein